MKKTIVIGFSGKAGSGKSFLAEHIGKETGVKVVKLDYQMAQVMNTPILKQLLQRKLKTKIPKAHEHIQLFPLWQNMGKNFSRFEYWFFRILFNRKVKKTIRKSKEQVLIIDFIALPIIKVTKKFDEMYLVTSDNDERLSRVGVRDNVTLEKSLHVEKLLKAYYDENDKFPFNATIENDYENIPAIVDEIISRLSAKESIT